MKLKKHPFILFELLIAIALVALVTLPFVQYPFLCLKEETHSLVKMELERVAEAALVDIKGELYQNLISWEVLTKQGKPSLPDLEKKIQISLPHNIHKSYVQRIYFWLHKQKKGQDDKDCFLVHVKTTFTPLKADKPELSVHKELFIKQSTKQEPILRK